MNQMGLTLRETAEQALKARRPLLAPMQVKAYVDIALTTLAKYVTDEMALHDDTGDPFDEGYMRAVNEILACCATENE